MDAHAHGETSSGARRQTSLVETPLADGICHIPPRSSFLDELRDDETTTVYSYYSTVSTNYTMSNLPGPGRLLGKFYSRAGKSLEKRLGRVVNRAAIKEYDDAVGMLRQWSSKGSFACDDLKDNERSCETLLVCARSVDINIQAETFENIVRQFVAYPSKVRSSFGRVFERRNEISDVTAFSWKRPGVEYPFRWLYWYKLASRCLSSHQNSFFEAVVQFDGVRNWSLDFSDFEDLLLSCGDASDSLFALRFIDWYWNREEDFSWSEGLKASALKQLANGLFTWWEVYSSHPNPDGWGISPYSTFILGNKLLEGMTRSSRKVDTDRPDGRFGYNTQLAMWADIFKVHQFLRSSGPFGRTKSEYPLVCTSWGELCHESLPKPEHANLRQSLLRMEDIYGSALDKRFTPRGGSVIDLEDRFLASTTRPIPGLVPCMHCSNPRELKSDSGRRYWGDPSWYDDQLRICDEMMMMIESTSTPRTSAAGVPYVTLIGRVAPNSCNVCYNTIRPSRPIDPSPILLLLIYHRGILTFLVLRVKMRPNGHKSPAEDSKENSFEGGFRITKKDVIQAVYLND
ncbi:hypothetical protein SCHPADRAFT_516060 [Schizopora paradoxa]|uniref:Uncharacterized protein n=1 Tax=Schizopora paradoxa TaxID=27342 RepID=A0A0H2RFF4_9AGAM|nr:hypothetical protein SCHPADRAFT_516060 [Schizopora paradoxa]